MTDQEYAELSDLRCLVQEVREALEFWVNERMVSYTDAQYGKGTIRGLLTKVNETNEQKR